MLVLFLLPFYVVVSIAFGTVDPIFRSPLPVFQPWWWTSKYLVEEWHLVTGEFLRHNRTLVQDFSMARDRRSLGPRRTEGWSDGD